MNRGEVVAVGPGSSDHPVTLKIGDRVILPGFGGAAVKLAGADASSPSAEELLLYREADILAKVSE
jgi:co-chaperonin GroES (HSP10)